MNINHFGTLYIVATPLGNLDDMSFRAVSLLQQVDLIAAEDTRHSFSLLQHFSIHKPLISLHEHNERERMAILLERLQQGESIALISDAGTPLISDPGYLLVHEAKKIGIRVVPIPGPCAAIAALSVSGLATERFLFEGFLPAKPKARMDRLSILLHEERTMIFYEAPHRILGLIKDLVKVFGVERKAVIARELTKIYETVQLGTLQELLDWVEQDKNQQRGEIVLILEGAKPQLVDHGGASVERVLTVLLEELPLKQAVELASKISGERKNDLYQRALQTKSSK